MAKPPKRKPRQKKTDKKQSERFRKAVRDEGLDVADDNFEHAFRRIAVTKKKDPPK